MEALEAHKVELRKPEASRDKAKLLRPRDLIHIRLRCKLCGRPRAVYRKFGVCRICFRNMASDGLIPGVRKASLVNAGKQAMMTDPIADMLTRIRNANSIERPAVEMPATKIRWPSPRCSWTRASSSATGGQDRQGAKAAAPSFRRPRTSASRKSSCRCS